MSTKLYGYVAKDGKRRDMTTAEEVAEYRDYWVEHHGLKNIPILIEETPTVKDTTAGAHRGREPAKIEDAYGTLGYPSFILVDKNGIVRFVMAGMDRALLTTMIDELRAEARPGVAAGGSK